MEALLGVVVAAAVVGIVIAFKRAAGRAASAIDGAVTGNTRKRGLAAVRTRTEFQAPVPGSVILHRIQETLQLGQQSAQGLKLGGRSDDGSSMTILRGNWLSTQLRFIVSTQQTNSGCNGFATVANWLESDGQITCTEHIERIHRHVVAAVQHFGGTHQVVVEPEH